MSILNYFRDSVGRLVRSSNSNAGVWTPVVPSTGLNTLIEQGVLTLQTTTSSANQAMSFDGAAASTANTISLPASTLFDLDISIVGKQSGSSKLSMTKRRVSGVRGLGGSGILTASALDSGANVGSTIGTDNAFGTPGFAFDDFFIENFGGSGRYLQVRVNGSATFTVSGITTEPTVGATYTNNGSTFTVTSVTLSGVAPTISGTITVTRTTGSNEPVPGAAALVKSAGIGDPTITLDSFTNATVNWEAQYTIRRFSIP